MIFPSRGFALLHRLTSLEIDLSQCLDSIVTQTLRDIETILFKLGSNDLNKTFREFSFHESLIRFLNLERGKGKRLYCHEKPANFIEECLFQDGITLEEIATSSLLSEQFN